MLCYVMLCYVMLCYVMLCYVVPEWHKRNLVTLSPTHSIAHMLLLNHTLAPFTNAFSHSFNHSLTFALIRSPTHTIIHPFLSDSPTHNDSFTRPQIHWHTRTFNRSQTHSLMHPRIDSLGHRLIRL